MGVSPPGVGLHCPVVMATKLHFALLDFGEQQRRIPPPRVVASSVPRSHRRVSISPLRIISGKTFSPPEGEGSPSARRHRHPDEVSVRMTPAIVDCAPRIRLISFLPRRIAALWDHAVRRNEQAIRRGRSFFKLRVRPAEFSAQAGFDSPIEASGRGRSELRAERERQSERTPPPPLLGARWFAIDERAINSAVALNSNQVRVGGISCSTSRIRRGAPAVTGNCKCGRRRGQELRPPPEGQEQVLPEQKEVWAAGVGAGGA